VFLNTLALYSLAWIDLIIAATKTMGTVGQQAPLSIVAVITLLLVDVAAAADHDLARHRHHRRQQQDHHHRSSVMTYDDVSSRCDDVCQLRQSVERLTAVQLDYGRALHAIYGLVDTVRRDVSAAR